MKVIVWRLVITISMLAIWLAMAASGDAEAWSRDSHSIVVGIGILLVLLSFALSFENEKK